MQVLELVNDDADTSNPSCLSSRIKRERPPRLGKKKLGGMPPRPLEPEAEGLGKTHAWGNGARLATATDAA